MGPPYFLIITNPFLLVNSCCSGLYKKGGTFFFFRIIKMEVEELLKVVLQDGNKDCGICSLLSIIRHYGGDVSKEYLRELTGTTKTGVSFYQLLTSARELGFSCEGVKGELSFLDSSRLPCIAHIVYQKKYQHFVVVYKVYPKEQQVLLMDPAKGKVVVSYAEFQMLSSGYFLYLMPVKTLPIYHEKKTLSLFIQSFCKKRRFYLFSIFFLSILCVVFQVITAFHFQYLFDYSVQFSIIDSIFQLSLFLGLIYSCYLFAGMLKQILMIKVSFLFDEELMQYVYKQILLLPYLFFKNRTLGEVLERFQDVVKVKDFFLQLFVTVVTDVFFFLIFSWLLFRIHSYFLILFLFYFLLSFCLGVSLYRIKRKKQKKILSRSDFFQSFLVESFQNVDTIKGLHLEYDFLNQFEKRYHSYLIRSYQLNRILLLEESGQQILYYLMLLIFYGIGAYFLIHGTFSIAQFFICQYIFQYLLGCGNRFLSFFFDSYQIPIAISRIQDLFTLFRENFDGGTYYQLMKLDGDIVFSQLSFSYSSRPLFSDFSLVIPAHTKVLFTGESGGGKSSLVKILMRYLEVPYGMVRIGGFDINHLHLELLRSRISYVTGNEFLFSNTLLYNITLNRDVSQEKVDEISQMVKLDTLLSKLPMGYQSMVEENGFNFSSGERQKILLARALLKNSDIYIFDEAFHQIDVDQERIILCNIFSYLKDKTVIVISHRLQHLELYDAKYRLEKGEICEL